MVWNKVVLYESVYYHSVKHSCRFGCTCSGWMKLVLCCPGTFLQAGNYYCIVPLKILIGLVQLGRVFLGAYVLMFLL